MKNPSVSVVIPTYNRAPLLRNTILSLLYQSYPISNYEIIVADDTSTDETMELVKSFSSNQLKTVSTKVNSGAGAARNRGVSTAEGDLIIFCDSDFILPYDFISNHVVEHEKQSAVALSGMGHWHYVYSYDFKDDWFSYQKKDLEEANEIPFLRERIEKSIDNYLLTEKDIYNKSIESFLFCPKWHKPWVSMFGEIIKTYGTKMKGFNYPWLSFCTGNVSLKKDLFLHLDGFNEKYRRREDWEFGYRLYSEGFKLRFSTKVEAYQQLVPISHERNKLEEETYVMLCKDYPKISMYLLALSLRNGLSYKKLSNILQQHKQLQQNKKWLPLTTLFEQFAFLYAFEKYPEFKRITITKEILYNLKKARKYEQVKDWEYAFNHFISFTQ